LRARTKAAAFGATLLAALWTVSCDRAAPGKMGRALIPVDGSPLVSLRILVRVGSAHDPSGKEGLALLTWNLLARGASRSMSVADIDEKLFPLDAELALSVDKEMAVFSGTVRREDLDRFYAVVRDRLLDPAFREDDFARLKTEQLAALDAVRSGEGDARLADGILDLMLYEGRPYGHPEAGTVSSVKGLTLDDVRAFYAMYFVQGDIVLGLAGGYPADFPDTVAADFARLPQGFTPRLVLPTPRRPRGLEIAIADGPSAVTTIAAGFPLAVSPAGKDFFALWVAQAHFGAAGQGFPRLAREIGQERGLAAEAFAAIEPFAPGPGGFPEPNRARQQQAFVIRVRPVPGVAGHFVLRQALRALRTLVEDGLSEDQFRLARDYLLAAMKLRGQTLGGRLAERLDAEFYGTEDLPAAAAAALPRLTREDVNRAMRKYLTSADIAVAVVAPDAEAFKSALAADAPSPLKYANPAMPRDVLDEDAIIQSYPLAAVPDGIGVAPAAEFFRTAGLPWKQGGIGK